MGKSLRVIFGILVVAVLATVAEANAPSVSERPVARPGSTPPPSIEDIIETVRFQGEFGAALVDVATGEIIEARNFEVAFTPASVTKTITAMYALDILGDEFSFDTEIGYIGSINGSVLSGDLVLVGTGDPTLDTDDLLHLVDQVKALGITTVSGRVLYFAGALPSLYEIDSHQPSYVGYNPSLSGLNLNFNRVYFEWKRKGNVFETQVDARSDTLRPVVKMARVGISERDGAVFTYENRDGIDRWNVRRNALGNGGGRWLPVRDAGRYTAEVLQQVLRLRGISVGNVVQLSERPEFVPIAMHTSAPLIEIVRDMLKYSTNLTAEVIGLTASMQSQRVESQRQSAELMQAWARTKLGMTTSGFVDHSGLGDQTRISPIDMVQALRSKHFETPDFVDVLKPIPVRDRNGNLDKAATYRVQAKTGTLNFVSTLSGYMVHDDGRLYAFVIFTQDLDARQNTIGSVAEQPKGAKAYNMRAKVLQRHLLARWGALKIGEKQAQSQ